MSDALLVGGVSARGGAPHPRVLGALGVQAASGTGSCGGVVRGDGLTLMDIHGLLEEIVVRHNSLSQRRQLASHRLLVNTSIVTFYNIKNQNTS